MDITPQILRAYFAGSLSPEDNLLVQEFLADNMDSPQVEAVMEEAFDSSRAEAGRKERRQLSIAKGRLGMESKRPSVRATWFIAAVAVLFLCLPLAFNAGYNMHKEPAPVLWQEICVPAAQTKDVTLPDGTLLSLNAGSRLTWPSRFTGDTREIFLEGEVMARVAKDEAHPFILNAPDVKVRVHGTTFNFKSYREDTTVEMVLLDGSVSMDVPTEAGKREVRLSPGDIALYDRNEGHVSLSRLSPDNFRPFTEGRSFSFFNIPLTDIASELQRCFGTRVVVADEIVAGRRFLAFFTNGEDLDQILSLLARNGGLRVRKFGDATYIYGK